MAQAEITQVRDVAADFTRQTTVTHKEIQYTIDGKGPFIAYMTAEEYTPDKAKQLVQTKAAEWAKTVGKLPEVK